MYVIDKSKYQFFTFLTILCMFILISSSALANEFDVYAKAESFTWKEYDNGTQILKESGPIYGIGATGKFYIRDKLTIKPKVELFGGTIDYDGQACNIMSGICFPSKTDTDYVGIKTEVDLGLKFMPFGSLSIGPFAGLGYRYWERDIKSTANATGIIEKWSSYYTRVGALLDLNISKVWKMFAEGGVKLPVYNENRVDNYDVTVKPGEKPSFFAEIGTKISILKTSIFYEGMRFSKSPDVYKGTFRYWQPESKADMYGINIGISF